MGNISGIEARRKILLNSPHIETIESSTDNGNIITFNTDMNAPLPKCIINFDLIQEGEGYPTPENIRPIKGWKGFEFYNSSANIFPLHQPSTAFRGQFSTGDTTIASASVLKCWTIYVGKNQDLYYQRKSTGVSCVLAFCDTPLTSRTGAVIYGALNMANRTSQKMNSGEHPYLVMCATDSGYVPNGGYETREVMLSFGNSAKPYAPRVDNNLIMPNWVDDMSSIWKDGDIPGGYLDLSTGILTTPYTRKIIDGVTNKASSLAQFSSTSEFTNLRGLYSVLLTDLANDIPYNTASYLKCSHFRWFTYSGRRAAVPDSIYFNSSTRNVRWCSSTFTTLEEFNGYLIEQNEAGTPVTLVYHAPTPHLYQLTPQQINSIKNSNCIWSSANGAVSVKYWTH